MFRREPEDMGAWTPVAYYSGREFRRKQTRSLLHATTSLGWRRASKARAEDDGSGRYGVASDATLGMWQMEVAAMSRSAHRVSGSAIRCGEIAEGVQVAVRRVVTGHSSDGKAVFVSDGDAPSMQIGERGSAVTVLWGRDEPAHFPDDGTEPEFSAAFAPPSGSRAALMELASQGDDFHEFVRDGLAQWADPDDVGMHRTATHDYDVVLEGVVGLELDDGAEVTLRPGDVVVLNGTRHRWHNRGDSIARVLAVSVGAHHEIEGGRPV
jgi:mannose-6-phosphate isomerase-like protein (cupin superfamily)